MDCRLVIEFRKIPPYCQRKTRKKIIKGYLDYLSSYEEAKKQDAASAEVFRKAGVEIAEMSAEDFDAWRALATETSYAKFVEEVKDGQALLDMALAVE